jgi:hypothetical protein
LSRSNQRLVKKLSRSAVVTPKLPVPRKSVLGIVETVRPTLPPSGLRLVSSRNIAPATTAPTTPAIAKSASVKPTTPTPAVSKPTGAKPAASKTQAVGAQPNEAVKTDLPSGQWRALGALAAVGLVVIVISAVKMPPSTVETHAANAPAAPHRSANKPSPAMVATTNVQQPQRWITPLPPETTMIHQEVAALTDSDEAEKPIVRNISHTPAPVTKPAVVKVAATMPPATLIRSIATERAFVSELPLAPFARPVVPERNLVGELQLKALIGADGAVKEVIVLSGNPVLARAGMRAVRQWHYGVSQIPGGAAETETHIKMSFFGEDAVSIASIGKYN